MSSRVYRKKPIAIEAFRVGIDETPSWAEKDVQLHIIQSEGTGYAEVHTLEGVMRCYFGDYIIKGAFGELYPCRADVFEDTYVPNEEECEDSIYKALFHKLYTLLYLKKYEEVELMLKLVQEWGSVSENVEFSPEEIKQTCHSILKKCLLS